MPHIHTFARPEIDADPRQIGTPYAPGYTRFDEGSRYLYNQGAHELSLFWSQPSATEIAGFRDRPIEVALYPDAALALLLYRIDQICEWSDVAFHYQRVPETERELPEEPTGERGRLRLFLVDCDTGLIVARRLVSLDKVMTQALRHTWHAQAGSHFDPLQYDLALQQIHARFPDSDALVRVAEVQEMALG